jgi:hypothetical protein
VELFCTNHHQLAGTFDAKMRSGKITKSAILMFSLFATFSLLNAQEYTRGVGIPATSTIEPIFPIID